MARKNITVTCDALDENATRKQLRKLGARDIEKRTYSVDSEGNRLVEFSAEVSGRRFNSKKSNKLYKLADSIERTVEA